jgi:hypothetical protein
METPPTCPRQAKHVNCATTITGKADNHMQCEISTKVSPVGYIRTATALSMRSVSRGYEVSATGSITGIVTIWSSRAHISPCSLKLDIGMLPCLRKRHCESKCIALVKVTIAVKSEG